jgi:TRAP-type C4-dicarboxylate transport system permease small subunit
MTGTTRHPWYLYLVRLGGRCEEYFLGLLLLAMIGLTCLQIILRSVFGSGLLWADPLVRYLVLWSGLLGTALATARGKHIAIDLAAYLFPIKMQTGIQTLCHLFSSLVAAGLCWASWLFIHSEIEFGNPGLLGIPSWCWNLIFPLAFVLITLRSLTLFIKSTIQLFHPSSPEQGEIQQP